MHPAPTPRRSDSWWAQLRAHDPARGGLLRGVIALSVPSILQSVLAFGSYQLGDLYLTGRLGPAAIAAAGATNQTLRQVVFLLLMGLGTAAQMLVARLVGAGRRAEAEHIAGQVLLVGAGLWLATAAVGLGLAEPLVRLVARDPEVVALGADFVRIAFPFVATAVFSQLATAVLLGAGDSYTPMLASFVTTPLALGFEWLFAFGPFGLPALGMSGIALGGGLGGLAGSWLLARALLRGEGRVRLSLSALSPDAAALRQVLRFSWQPSLHMLARTGITFFFMALAGRLGGDVQAAYTIGQRVEMLAFMIAFPIANACATLVGQNLGAGSLPRAWRAIWVSAAAEVSLMWPAALLLFLFRRVLVRAFTADPAVAELAAEYLAYSSALLFFSGVYFVAFRSLQAAGDMTSPMVISLLLAGGLGIPLALLLTRQSELGATGMWIANLAYGVCNTLAMGAWLLTGRWARRHRPTAPVALPDEERALAGGP
jgi:putative MATE family efflux protein